MASDTRGPLDLHFNLGPFPVVVEPFFWLVTGLIGFRGGDTTGPEALAWMAVCFVSILVHELGHALAARAFGAGSYIRLHGFGGSCHSDRTLSRWRDVLMSAAGPGAGFLLGGLVMLAMEVAPPTSALGYFVYAQLKWVNFGWGLFNLLPVLPLDGGRIFAGLVGPTRRRAAFLVGSVTAVGLTALFLSWHMAFSAAFFGYLVFQNVQALRAERAVPRVRRQKAAPPEPDALPRGWAALHAGEVQEAGRLAHLAKAAARTEAELNAARDLLAWVALAEGDAGGALRHLEKVAPAQAARGLSWALAMEQAGAPERAVPHALRALEQEPSDTSAALAVRLLVGQGRLDEAQRVCESYGWRSAAVGDRQRASVALARGELPLAASLYAAAFDGGGRAADAYGAAMGHARSGQREQAALWLQRALDAGFDDLEQLSAAPELAEVRALPEVAARLGRAAAQA